ncbi:hypothetical protein ZOSMA_2424G00020 [Zostera marina]|uniref:Uncharacterized protein n=1 Tax=Zostera marina TaxID=29655 RepID=A0A0K9PJ66_ZOSMR|nr:hypothetical protein ZOSMA_2424G00020 [Zostera marina]
MCIELDYTPFRKDGLKGFPVTIRSSIIHPAEPKGTELIIPICCEDQQVVPKKSYYGGHEGDGVYNWYRANKKMEMADMITTFLSEGALAVGNDIIYTPTLEDVGAYLVLCWLPTRNDGKPGEPVIAISNPVLAALPVVSNVCIKKLSSTAYVGEGKYYGGHEGPNIYSWYRETAEGTTSIINGANSTIYEVTDFDYNFQLIFGYMPVRSDSIVGELKLSEPTKTIFPELPQIELLSFLGKEVEGEILRAIETISKVMYKYEKGEKLGPIEEVTIEVNEEHVGVGIEALSQRRAEVTDMGPVPGSVDKTRMTLTCPSRGLVTLHDQKGKDHTSMSIAEWLKS